MTDRVAIDRGRLITRKSYSQFAKSKWPWHWNVDWTAGPAATRHHGIQAYLTRRGAMRAHDDTSEVHG
jgi:hypothetical protein